MLKPGKSLKTSRNFSKNLKKFTKARPVAYNY